MTIPLQEYYTLRTTHAFLIELATAPKVPKEIKTKAFACLKHFPSPVRIDDLYEEHLPKYPSRF